MEHHEPSGMFFNWYDEATGEKLRTWPEDGEHRRPVRVQRRQRLAGRRPAGREELRAGGSAPLAAELFDRMDLDAFYNPGEAGGHPTTAPAG